MNEVENYNCSKNGDFYKIGINSKTDKISTHNYHNFYPKFLEYYSLGSRRGAFFVVYLQNN
jgi:hypothetical protein